MLYYFLCTFMPPTFPLSAARPLLNTLVASLNCRLGK